MTTDWGTPVIEWIAKLSLKTKWITKLSVNTIVIFMLLVAVANKAYHEMECSKIRARIHKVEGLQRRCTRDENKAKGAILVEIHRNFHAKHLENEALRRWHDFAACATYRASQQAAAKAKAVALQAAIDAVAAEQVTTDEGAGACVLS